MNLGKCALGTGGFESADPGKQVAGGCKTVAQAEASGHMSNDESDAHFDRLLENSRDIYFPKVAFRQYDPIGGGSCTVFFIKLPFNFPEIPSEPSSE
ncbi:hypothetical protein TNCV_890831 [Trichonephila clavipes]|nr:hypothetical protein TNCV_890831 [Trichonephila clavipes]